MVSVTGWMVVSFPELKTLEKDQVWMGDVDIMNLFGLFQFKVLSCHPNGDISQLNI